MRILLAEVGQVVESLTDSRLLPAHDEIWVMLCHAAPMCSPQAGDKTHLRARRVDNLPGKPGNAVWSCGYWHSLYKRVSSGNPSLNMKIDPKWKCETIMPGDNVWHAFTVTYL